MPRDHRLDRVVAHARDGFVEVGGIHHLDALVEDGPALVVHHIVVFQEVLSNVEIAALDLLLGLLQSLVDPGVDDRLVLLEAELGQHRIHALGAEDAHQIVLQGQIEFRAAGISLTAGAPAQLVVDAARFVSLRGQNVKATGLDRLVLEALDVGLDRVFPGGALGALRHVGQLALGAHVEIAAELDVGAAAGHVGGDGHRAGNARLRDDVGLLLVIARIQHLKAWGLRPSLRSRSARSSDFSIDVVPTRIGWPRFAASWISLEIALNFSSKLR